MDLIQKIKRIELYSYKNGSQYFSILPSTIHDVEMSFSLMSLEQID